MMHMSALGIRTYVFGVLAALVFLFLPLHSHAALLYLDPGEATVNRGDTITLSLRVDTDSGECINTADVVIKYSDSIRAVDVSRGESILNVWLQDPAIDEKKHEITFAGGIPGGYCGRIPGDPMLTNKLADVVFRSPGFTVGNTGGQIADVSIDGSSRVLLNDGFGTEAKLRVSDAHLTLTDKPGSTTKSAWNDTVNNDKTPPADFAITLQKDANAFSGKYFIVFNSVDKQSGIDHYEVMEEPFKDFNLFKWGAVTAPWTSAESPYVLKDQSLNSTIRVKAVDKAGNETVETLVPEPALRSASKGRILTIVLLVALALIVLSGIGYWLWRRRKKLLAEYNEQQFDTSE